VKVFAYSGKDENNTGQKKFLDMLDINGYVVRTKVVKKIKSGAGGVPRRLSRVSVSRQPLL